MNLPDHQVLAKGTDGPFLCSLCEYFRAPDTCTHEYIVEHYGATVGGDWCCDFFEKDPAMVSTATLLKKRMDE